MLNNERSVISLDAKKNILAYYVELYRNYEVKTTPEIASELCMSEQTVRKFHNEFISSTEETYSEVGMIIMLCTVFAPTSRYYEMQQKVYGELIEQRALIKKQKDRHKEIAQMVIERSKAYMKKRSM